MANLKLLAEINATLKQEREEAAAYKENPRLIKVMDVLIRLTNSEEDNRKQDEESAKNANACPHDVLNRRTGKCVACGEEVEAKTA